MLERKCNNCDKKCQRPELEDKLVEWIEGQRYIVTRNMIRIQALAKAIEMKTTNLYASNNWCTRFLNRNNSHTSPEVKNCSKAAHVPRREDHRLPLLWN